jgi:hypothetical protein
MRRSRKRQNVFIGLTFNSLFAIIGIIGLMVVCARSFGELAIPAINMMVYLIFIPTLTLIIGILGWFWTTLSERTDWR